MRLILLVFMSEKLETESDKLELIKAWKTELGSGLDKGHDVRVLIRFTKNDG